MILKMVTDVPKLDSMIYDEQSRSKQKCKHQSLKVTLTLNFFFFYKTPQKNFKEEYKLSKIKVKGQF